MNYFLTEDSRHPLQNIFWPENSSLLRKTLQVLMGVVVLAIASQLSVPFRPVPLTFQSATVVLIGMAYGSRQGAAVILSYLVAGALGLPVFANHSAGFAHFFGPTGGYLLGFLPAAFISGYLAEKGFGRTILSSFFTACVGTLIIFACGLSVLSTLVGWQNAVASGLAIFSFSEPVKLLAVACIIPRLWKSKKA